MCIAIAYFPGCNVINSENSKFLIKLFFYMTKKSTPKLKCLENEKKKAYGGTKIFLNHF